MATYVNDLRLKEIATGDESGTWGTSTNTNLELIGEAVSYATQESFSSDADVTTTVADGAADPARAFYFKVTSSGSLSATRVLTIAPNTMSRVQIIGNATSGSQIITIKQGTGATVNIPNGETRMVYMDGAGSGAAVVDALADINVGGKLTVGVDDTGYDVTLFGATSGQKVFWDESADTLYQTCTVDIDGTVTVGVDDTGYDVKFFGDTSGNYMLWDTSANSLLVNGDIDMVTNGNRIDLDTDNDTSIRASADDTITVEIGGSDLIALTTTSTFSCPLTVGVNDTGHDVNFFGATAGQKVFWDESADTLYQTCTVDIDGTVTVGVDDTGYDVKFFGDTASAYMLWDTSADDLILAGAARVVVPASGLVIGSTAVSSTAAELNLLDALDRGSILYGNSSGATAVLGQGSADQVLTSDGTDISWEDAGGGVSGLTGLVENNSIWLGADPSSTTSTAAYSVALGTTALDAITTGDNNVAIGYGALTACTTGTGNVAVGALALDAYVDKGNNNTAIGYKALTAAGASGAPDGHNIGVGMESLMSLTTGSYNTGVGGRTQTNATTSDYNVSLGYATLLETTTGANNTAVGHKALLNNTTASNNTAVGYLALDANTTGTTNVAVGTAALGANTTGDQNVAIGSEALDANTTATGNVAVGFRALSANTTGGDNVAMGEAALEDNTTGTLNTAVGFRALAANTTTNNCTALGYGALEASIAANNTAVGTYAGVAITTGGYNVALGVEAGDKITTGQTNICIGYGADTSASSSDNQIVIGPISGGENNQFTFGKASNVVQNEFDTDANWTRTSDIRKKRDIKDDTLGLGFINDLRTVTHKWKPSNEFPKEWQEYSEENNMNLDAVMHGMIAQEVKGALDKAGVDTFTGWKERSDGSQTVSREMFVIPLIKAVQELSAEVKALKQQLNQEE